ncbi:hypothetical protein HRbin06_01038 [archaeon HR06]|nr:hypothetical protein HRbin06_01038 [archaeon HR06]
MKVKELREGMRKVNIDGTIKDLSEPKTVNLKSGERAKIVEAKFEDDSGSINLTLWDERGEEVKEGLKVRIENGYVNSFRGELRLNVGKYGKITILEK